MTLELLPNQIGNTCTMLANRVYYSIIYHSPCVTVEIWNVLGFIDHFVHLCGCVYPLLRVVDRYPIFMLAAHQRDTSELHGSPSPKTKLHFLSIYLLFYVLKTNQIEE